MKDGYTHHLGEGFICWQEESVETIPRWASIDNQGYIWNTIKNVSEFSETFGWLL